MTAAGEDFTDLLSKYLPRINLVIEASNKRTNLAPFEWVPEVSDALKELLVEVQNVNKHWKANKSMVDDEEKMKSFIGMLNVVLVMCYGATLGKGGSTLISSVRASLDTLVDACVDLILEATLSNDGTKVPLFTAKIESSVENLKKRTTMSNVLAIGQAMKQIIESINASTCTDKDPLIAQLISNVVSVLREFYREVVGMFSKEKEGAVSGYVDSLEKMLELSKVIESEMKSVPSSVSLRNICWAMFHMVNTMKTVDLYSGDLQKECKKLDELMNQLSMK